MRLQSILLVASALTLVASSNALPSATFADQNPSVFNAAPIGADLSDVGLKTGEVKRSLRGYEEERLGSTNMFKLEKLDEALNNDKYAKILFRRWNRHGFDEDKVTDKFKRLRIHTDKNAIELYNDYVKWIKAHPVKKDPKTDSRLFSREKIYKAFDDGTYANKLFGRWKRNNLDSDDVFAKFQTMGVKKDDKLYKVYKDYFKWLNIHHPLEKTTKMEPKKFLFEPMRIERAQKDAEFAERLFTKWKASGLDHSPVHKNLVEMGLKNGNGLDDLYKSYVKWLDIHHPLPARATR